LDFPEDIDLLAVTSAVETDSAGESAMRKNFVVETAEYVTTLGQQYAQTFILDRPIRLEKAGLALHKFGGEGQLWIELYADNQDKPGAYLSTSEMIDLDNLPMKPGYRWVDFRFDENEITLSPGRYWLLFGFTGTPIVNWFFSYGKPVGPPDGTQVKIMFDEDWMRTLNFEFNYRVVGKTPP
jgi:hypothetical protein